MKGKYAKGARAERDLARRLVERGFVILRAAGSGGNLSIPDVVGIKKGRILAFECKAWETTPRLKKQEYQDFKDWCEKGGALGFLAWRNNNQWLFLNVKDLETNNIREGGITLDDLMFVVNI